MAVSQLGIPPVFPNWESPWDGWMSISLATSLTWETLPVTRTVSTACKLIDALKPFHLLQGPVAPMEGSFDDNNDI